MFGAGDKAHSPIAIREISNSRNFTEVIPTRSNEHRPTLQKQNIDDETS
jgi:hypothetical protein